MTLDSIWILSITWQVCQYPVNILHLSIAMKQPISSTQWTLSLPAKPEDLPDPRNSPSGEGLVQSSWPEWNPMQRRNDLTLYPRILDV